MKISISLSVLTEKQQETSNHPTFVCQKVNFIGNLSYLEKFQVKTLA